MTISRRTLLSGAAAVIAAPAVVPGGRAFGQDKTIKLTIASSHPLSIPWVEPLKTVMVGKANEELEKAKSPYRINWTEAFGGSLYGFQDTLTAVTNGLTDIGWIGALWEPAKLPLQNLMYKTPFATNSVEQAVDVMNELNDHNEAVGKEWTAQKVVCFGACVSDGYHIFTKFPVNSLDDLKGKKFVGAPVLAPWVQGVGVTVVVAGLPVMYSQIQTGIADGCILIPTGAWPLKIHEVAPYITEIDTGPLTFGGSAMNADSYKRLPPEVQKVIKTLGRQYSAENARLINVKHDLAMKSMAAAGAKVTTMSQADRKKLVDSMPPLTKLWADDLEKKGVPAKAVLTQFMKSVRDHGGKPLRDWDKEV
jgi:TRAP-type C4-dicarboxylate transport system substrate-binding protein